MVNFYRLSIVYFALNKFCIVLQLTCLFCDNDGTVEFSEVCFKNLSQNCAIPWQAVKGQMVKCIACL